MRVFYTWQSDTPRVFTKQAERSIKDAISQINRKFSDIDLIFDESTRDNPGSPEIVETIFEKIANSDIFICDITFINSESSDKRKLPNPNVLIELGYAIRSLGWERIIMIFNTHFGDIKDLPFDLNNKRVTQFCIKGTDDSNAYQLKGSLIKGLETIIQKNPPYGTTFNEKEIIKKRDIENLKWFLSSIDFHFFDAFMEALPNTLLFDISHYFAGVEGILQSSRFHIYDNNLKNKIKNFYKLWNDVLNHSEIFQPVEGQLPMCKVQPDITKYKNSSYQKLLKQKPQLAKALSDMLIYIRENYYEIDIESLSKEARIGRVKSIQSLF